MRQGSWCCATWYLGTALYIACCVYCVLCVLRVVCIACCVYCVLCVLMTQLFTPYIVETATRSSPTWLTENDWLAHAVVCISIKGAYYTRSVTVWELNSNCQIRYYINNWLLLDFVVRKCAYKLLQTYVTYECSNSNN